MTVVQTCALPIYMIDWVVGVPSQGERKVLLEACQRAVRAAECVIEQGCQKAMNSFN